MRLRRKPRIDREKFPHVYNGPETRWGLKPDTPCRIMGNRAGGRRIMIVDGRMFTVGRTQVERYTTPV